MASDLWWSGRDLEVRLLILPILPLGDYYYSSPVAALSHGQTVSQYQCFSLRSNGALPFSRMQGLADF